MEQHTPHRFVLVVDDDPDIRETLELILAKHGHTVRCASDGQSALDKLRQGRDLPCVILLDLMMPGMNGFQFHDALTAEPALSGVPIVVITGAGGELEARARSFSSVVLRKPFELGAMLNAIGKHCASSA
jgi:CheY-like chemotaxis protein